MLLEKHRYEKTIKIKINASKSGNEEGNIIISETMSNSWALQLCTTFSSELPGSQDRIREQEATSVMLSVEQRLLPSAFFSSPDTHKRKNNSVLNESHSELSWKL